jgi:hypothetical protein
MVWVDSYASASPTCASLFRMRTYRLLGGWWCCARWDWGRLCTSYFSRFDVARRSVRCMVMTAVHAQAMCHKLREQPCIFLRQCCTRWAGWEYEQEGEVPALNPENLVLSCCARSGLVHRTCSRRAGAWRGALQGVNQHLSISDSPIWADEIQNETSMTTNIAGACYDSAPSKYKNSSISGTCCQWWFDIIII